MRDRFMVSDTNAFTHLDSYLLHEGIEERKDFYKEHSDLSSGGISRGLLNVKYDETEQEFIQKFNDGSNGLFTQTQSKKEVSDFQNIYLSHGQKSRNEKEALIINRVVVILQPYLIFGRRKITC